MNKFQAAFEILYILSCADGHVSSQEIEVIQQFMDSNYGNMDFDTAGIINSLSCMTGEGFMEELSLAANVFKEYSTVQDKLIILDFAYNLIYADGYITDDEAHLFISLGQLWNVDIQRYLQNKLVPSR